MTYLTLPAVEGSRAPYLRQVYVSGPSGQWLILGTVETMQGDLANLMIPDHLEPPPYQWRLGAGSTHYAIGYAETEAGAVEALEAAARAAAIYGFEWSTVCDSDRRPCLEVCYLSV